MLHTTSLKDIVSWLLSQIQKSKTCGLNAQVWRGDAAGAAADGRCGLAHTLPRGGAAPGEGASPLQPQGAQSFQYFGSRKLQHRKPNLGLPRRGRLEKAAPGEGGTCNVKMRSLCSFLHFPALVFNTILVAGAAGIAASAALDA